MKKPNAAARKILCALTALFLFVSLSLSACNKTGPEKGSSGSPSSAPPDGEASYTSDGSGSSDAGSLDGTPGGPDDSGAAGGDGEDSGPSAPGGTSSGASGGDSAKTADFKTPVKISSIKNAAELMSKLGKTPAAADLACYDVAEDGGLIYNPLSADAALKKALNKYDKASFVSGSLKLGNTTVSYSYPKTMNAYDMVPVRYKIQSGAGTKYPMHFTVNTFESAKSDGKALYDLNMPGKVDVDVEYLGYVGANYDNGKKPVLSKDFNDRQGTAYPSYNTQALKKSGTVNNDDIVWFKFKYTNTGNTVLDPEGNGTFCFEPLLYQKNTSGQYVKLHSTVNLYERIFDYLYPGESGEMYVTFDRSSALPAGDYRIVLNGLVRNEIEQPNWGATIWGGYTYTTSSFDFSVAANASVTAPKPVVKGTVRAPARNEWLHYYEEFMSSYITVNKEGAESGVIYVQPQPWATKLTFKLLDGNELQLAKAQTPVTVRSDSIKVNFNPNNQNYVTRADGTRYPMIATQSMADMRSNTQRGPDAASTIVNDMRDMKEAGINYLATTVAFGYDLSAVAQGAGNRDAFKFAMDVARVMGFKVEGYSSYPYADAITPANAISGEKLTGTGYGDVGAARANAILADYTLKRYGDLMYQNQKNKVLVTAEDTRGWLRVDISNRYPTGRTSLLNFRTWLTALYGNVKNVNKAYGSNYAAISVIDPESEANKSLKSYTFNMADSPYRDWSKAITDYDIYRTVERAENYENVLKNMAVKNAVMSLRTEGACWIVAGINPATTNSHYRHIYYSQRRNAIIAEILLASGTVSAHTDYITLPYTDSEVETLTALAVKQGIVPIHLPQFNRLRDIAVNLTHGSVNYTNEYNTLRLTKGAYVNTVRSLFTWWKATYENGGVPGILWQDYLCDGMVTATQFKEMKFFKQKLDEALNTAAGKAWSKSAPKLDASWKTNYVVGAWSYPKAYVESMVADTARKRLFN